MDEALRIMGTLVAYISLVSYGYKNSFSSSKTMSTSSKKSTLRGLFKGVSVATSSAFNANKF